MKEGSVIIAAFTQKDRQLKPRPAVLLKKVPPYNDYLICAVSSQLYSYVDGLDIVIDTHHSDFRISGLKTPSVIRAAMIMTIPSNNIQGSIGELSDNTYQQLFNQLCDFIKSGI